MAEESAEDPIRERLLALLEARGWTQRRLAQETGVPAATISAMCRGDRRAMDMKVWQLIRICLAFGVSPNDFIGWSLLWILQTNQRP